MKEASPQTSTSDSQVNNPHKNTPEKDEERARQIISELTANVSLPQTGVQEKEIGKSNNKILVGQCVYKVSSGCKDLTNCEVQVVCAHTQEQLEKFLDAYIREPSKNRSKNKGKKKKEVVGNDEVPVVFKRQDGTYEGYIVKMADLKSLSAGELDQNCSQLDYANSFFELYRFPESPVYEIDERYESHYPKLIGRKLYVVGQQYHETKAYKDLFKSLHRGRRIGDPVVVAMKTGDGLKPVGFDLIPKSILVESSLDSPIARQDAELQAEKDKLIKARVLRGRIEESESIFANSLEYRIARQIARHMEMGNRGYMYSGLLKVFKDEVIPRSKLTEHLESIKETLATIGIELKGNLFKGGKKRIRLE